MLMRAPEQLNGDYSAIKKKIDSSYNASQSLWQEFWNQANIDTRLEAGDGSINNDLTQPFPFNRSNIYFNRVRPLCNMVSGYQRRNRKSTIVVPLENGDQQTADQWSKILLNIYKKEGVYDTISDAFHHGACITGMNMLHIYLDYSNDPVNGDIKIDNLSYNSFFIDPYFRKLDLSDANFIWRRTFMNHTAAAMLLPEHYDEIMDLPGNPSGIGKDGRFQYMPESYGQNYQNQVAYDQYYYRSYRKQKLLVDKQTGDTFDVTDQDNINIELFLSRYDQIELIEQQIPTVRLAIMVQDRVFYDGPNPLNIDFFPFVPIVGYYNPMMPYFYSRIQGICRSLRDPQMMLNRRIILSSNAAESVVNTGFIFKENAVIDVKHLFQTGEGRIIPLKAEAQMTDIQQITAPNIPQYFFELQATFSKELNLVTGISEEMQGMNIQDTAGILAALRQGAGLTSLQPLFDKLDFAQNMLGNKIMSIVQKNYTPGKVKNILEGEEPAPLFYNKAFGKYHSMTELGFNTESQKQMQFAQLVELKRLGVPFPDEALIEAATIQNKDKITAMMKQQQEAQQQQQQQQQQSEMQLRQAQAELANARSIADKGLGYERVSRIAENEALADERKAQAVKDRYSGILDLAKALKELENIDIGQLKQIIDMQKALESNENPQHLQNRSDVGLEV